MKVRNVARWYAAAALATALISATPALSAGPTAAGGGAAQEKGPAGQAATEEVAGGPTAARDAAPQTHAGQAGAGKGAAGGGAAQEEGAAGRSAAGQGAARAGAAQAGAGREGAAREGAAGAAVAALGGRGGLPVCSPAGRSTRAPTVPAGAGAPGACRAATSPIVESGVRLPRRGEAGFTPSGYHHLGANTAGEWGGVSGRMSIVDGSIRPRSYDFVAGRFMVKRNLGRGVINWLEAGWAETGWAGTGRQHIYTFNTNTKTWQFYDQYALRPGDKVWLDLHSDPDGVWSAWLWWGNRWNLLTAQRLPLGSTAVIEQYVEVHVDAGRPGLIDVPPVTVDNVRLRPADGGEPRLWREDVPTLTGTDPTQRQQRGGFCLDWRTRYDTWTAGDCSRGLLSPAAPLPPPRGDADVIGEPYAYESPAPKIDEP